MSFTSRSPRPRSAGSSANRSCSHFSLKLACAFRLIGVAFSNCMATTLEVAEQPGDALAAPARGAVAVVVAAEVVADCVRLVAEALDARQRRRDPERADRRAASDAARHRAGDALRADAEDVAAGEARAAELRDVADRRARLEGGVGRRGGDRQERGGEEGEGERSHGQRSDTRSMSRETGGLTPPAA